MFAFGFGFGKSFASKTSGQAAKQRRKLQLQFLVFSTTNIYVYYIYKYICVCYFVPIAGGKHFRSGQRKIEAFPVCLQKKKVNYEISASLLLQLCCRLLSLMWLLFFFSVAVAFREKF